MQCRVDPVDRHEIAEPAGYISDHGLTVPYDRLRRAIAWIVRERVVYRLEPGRHPAVHHEIR